MTSTYSAPRIRPTSTKAGITTPSARPILLADAALTGVNGLAYVAIPGLLSDWFGIPSGLLVALGILLLVVAADLAYVATRAPIPRAGVRGLALVNGAWVVASVAYAFAADLTTLGLIWVIAQAAIVLVFAELQLNLVRGKTRTPGSTK